MIRLGVLNAKWTALRFVMLLVLLVLLVLYYEDVRLRTSDGLTLHAWFIPGDLTMTPKATWVWFHGNGGNNGYRIDELALAHHRTNANLFIFDYRGYGESDGSPSEEGTYLDSRAAMDYLLSRSDVDQDHIIYLGHSLGAAVAVELGITTSMKLVVSNTGEQSKRLLLTTGSKVNRLAQTPDIISIW